jgi:hypothetical protein
LVFTYHKLSGHQDDDAAVGGGLSIGVAEHVLHLLEGEALQTNLAFSDSSYTRTAAGVSHRKLLDNGGSAERLSALKREHGVLALFFRSSSSALAHRVHNPTRPKAVQARWGCMPT